MQSEIERDNWHILRKKMKTTN